jgi:hypothetical protein
MPAAFFPKPGVICFGAGLLTYLGISEPSRVFTVAFFRSGFPCGKRLTAAGTVSDFHGIPFSSAFRQNLKTAQTYHKKVNRIFVVNYNQLHHEK